MKKSIFFAVMAAMLALGACSDKPYSGPTNSDEAAKQQEQKK